MTFRCPYCKCDLGPSPAVRCPGCGKVMIVPKMREPNKYTEYFGDNLFDVMLETADSIGKIVVTDDRFPNAVSTIQKNVMYRVLEENSQTPADALKEAADEIRSMS